MAAEARAATARGDPVPRAQGRPGAGYPWFWEIHTWVEGQTAPVEEIDTIQAARDLAELVRALQAVDPTGAPPAGRGVALADRDSSFQYWLERFEGDRRVVGEWERALAAPPWHGRPLWHHGDLDCRNWLVRDGRITGVIDWGSMGVGDPACDVMVAWKPHSHAARDAFREALPTDDATWARARGWAVSQAVAALAYYTPENNPSLYREAETWLALVLGRTSIASRAGSSSPPPSPPREAAAGSVLQRGRRARRPRRRSRRQSSSRARTVLRVR